MFLTVAPLILLTQAAPDCPDESTAAGRWRIKSGELSCAELAKRSLPARAITAPEKRRIIAAFDKILVDAPSARWEWGKVVRGSIACLSINSKNRMGGYSGWTSYTFDLETGEALNIEGIAEMLAVMNPDEPHPDICA